MIIAIASTENHLKALVDSHFGRCDWYYIFDNKTQKNHFIENPVRYEESHAGCKAAELLISKGVKMVIAGRFGSKVVDVFRKNNIQMIVPEKLLTLNEIIKQIK